MRRPVRKLLPRGPAKVIKNLRRERRTGRRHLVVLGVIDESRIEIVLRNHRRTSRKNPIAVESKPHANLVPSARLRSDRMARIDHLRTNKHRGELLGKQPQ